MKRSAAATLAAYVALAALGAAGAAGCAKPPAILEFTVIEDTTDTIGPYVVYASVIDDHGIDEVGLRYLDGESPRLEFFVRVPMLEVIPGVYRGEIPGFPVGTIVNYFVAARDVDGLTARAPSSPVGDTYQRFNVVAPVPCVADPECAPGEICDRDTLVCRGQPAACEVDADCPRDAVCDIDAGACRVLPRACALDTDCRGEEICDEMLDLCVPRPGCDTDADCPGGRACEPLLGVCVRACDTASDCAPTEVCPDGICALPGS
ncbi:MAG TPA: hypothetical protein VG389_12440 [Myxococcota bacterium]|jgi:hypothetical protein|nr:hypothetical protein [Myxococcota bacterium]